MITDCTFKVPSCRVIADARRLLTELTDSYDSTWQKVAPHLFPGRELTAKYAFDDLWESVHGND